MAISRSHHFIISTYSLLLLFIPYAAPLNFNFPNIVPSNMNRDIICEGNGSYISETGIQVTPDGIGSDRNMRAGRATYLRPFRLWNKATRELANFTTNFTFVIDSNGARQYADGLTFFLAENNSVITAGGAIGLPVNFATNAPINQFVAVEFDTYWNDWDPRDSSNASIGNHVGINVNSLTSVRYLQWWTAIMAGGECQAWINYDSASKNLSVAFTGFVNDTVVRQVGLDHTIDLRVELPESVIFGFTAATGAQFQKNNVKSWAFSSSDLQMDEKNQLPQTTSPNPTKGENRNGLVLGLVAGFCVLIAFVSAIAFVVWKKKKKKKNRGDEVENLGYVEMSKENKGDEVEDLGYDVEMKNKENRGDDVEDLVYDEEMNRKFEKGSGPKRFSYVELDQCTKHFAEELGEGGFGKVYRGSFEGTKVAVKRLSKTSSQGNKEFAAEVLTISRLRHGNLVQLIGWCHAKKERLLVYEFMENGSLDSHLFKENSLTWGIRYKIAKGLASALMYLQKECEHWVLHRDIKSSNVMLDSKFKAKLGDFGLAKFVDHEKGLQTTMLAGTIGYIAPEYAKTGKASKESDVFSFGIVALELACGRRSIESSVPQQKLCLVDWVRELYEIGEILEAADPRLKDFNEEEIKRLMIVGLWCANHEPTHRPSISKAIQMLESADSPPSLPPETHAATSFTPPTSGLYGVTSIVKRIENQSSSSIYNTDSLNFTVSSATSTSFHEIQKVLYSMLLELVNLKSRKPKLANQKSSLKLSKMTHRCLLSF